MSIRTELAAVAVLTVALVAAVLLARATPKPTVENEPASTYRTGPGGAKAVYDVLARLHVPVERRRRPLFGLTRDERHRPGILAVVAVVEPLEPAELDQISSYLRDSGSVVAVGTAGGLTRCLGWVAAPSYKKFEVDSLPVTLVAAGPELKLPRVVRYLRPVREDS